MYICPRRVVGWKAVLKMPLFDVSKFERTVRTNYSHNGFELRDRSLSVAHSLLVGMSLVLPRVTYLTSRDL